VKTEDLNALGTRVLASAFQVHTTLGPGLLESAYVTCLVYELRRSGLDVKTEVPVPLIYEGEKLADIGYRIDVLVENELIVEVKSLEGYCSGSFSPTSLLSEIGESAIGISAEFQCRTFERRCLQASEPVVDTDIAF
jgi:GxxExxY protein